MKRVLCVFKVWHQRKPTTVFHSPASCMLMDPDTSMSTGPGPTCRRWTIVRSLTRVIVLVTVSGWVGVVVEGDNEGGSYVGD